jgi:diguanylate cyclase (GGDEF)-like protein
VTPSTVRTLSILAVPAGALFLLNWLKSSDASLPAPLTGIELYAPYAALMLSSFMSAWFNRGRALFALLLLAIAQFAYAAMTSGAIDSALGTQTLLAAGLLVPLNLAVLAWLPERGVLNAYGLRRLFFVIAQAATIALLVRSGVDLPGLLMQRHWEQFSWLAPATSPPVVIPVVAVAIVASAIAAILRNDPVDAALCGAIVAFALACHSAEHSTDYGLLLSTAALLIMIGVLQDSYRMAFGDELTGLPSRRALNERMMGLGHRFAIAMVDVDHFKRFNDTYGHETGDHVLKMVAAKLSQVRSGGRAFRYGGEEFALLFPNRSARRVQRELEALRISVEKHRLALRNMQRPLEAKAGRSRRGSASPVEGVAVTISIGLAERTDAHRSPEQVLQAADRALYRAKEKGRNRVSR